ncbi:MAG TPA: type IV secretory system conjugative DNA transfer family protein [Pirellulales bacterium]|nr:type IV secretory system conjugative DNA transfer family protein [Pirellulales bacterium]
MILIAFVVMGVLSVCFLGAVSGPGLAVLIVVCGLAWAGKRRRVLSAFGTARFAAEEDLQQAGMLSGRGLMIGTLLGSPRPRLLGAMLGLINPFIRSADATSRFLRAIFPKVDVKPSLVRLSRAVHTGIFCPTGGGKGVSCMIPFLLECPDSCVAVDFGGALAKATMKRRRRMGQRIVLLDGYKLTTNSPDTFNPVSFIDKNSPYAIDEIRDLASALVIRNPQEREPHWADSAETWIAAMIAAVVQYGDPDDRSLQTVRNVLSDPQKMEMATKLLCGSDAWQGMLARMGHQLTHYKDKELGSTLTTVNRHLRFLDTLAVADSTRTSSFDPNELVNGKMTVYLILPPEHARTQSPLLRMSISSMLQAVVRGGLQERKLVHFVLDEASSLGHMEQIDDAVDKYRGYGARLIFGFQSLGQLKKCFPDGQDQTLLSNVTQVFFGVNEPETAEYVSNRLGEQTIIVDSGGTSRGTSQQHSARDYGSYSTSSNSNHNWQQHGRKLLKPEEVTGLSARTAITFAPGVPPICTRLSRYYEGRPDALWRRLVRGLRATACSLLLLGTSIFVAEKLASEYRYMLQHPPVRAVPRRQFHSGRLRHVG